jgi:hypothetical protein
LLSAAKRGIRSQKHEAALSLAIHGTIELTSGRRRATRRNPEQAVDEAIARVKQIQSE